MDNLKFTFEVQVPLTSGKQATLTLRDGAVEIVTPVSFSRPEIKLEDLRSAVAELADAQARLVVEEAKRWYREADLSAGRPPAR